MNPAEDPWIRRNSLIGAEKLHALGVITFYWNACEHRLGDLFTAVAGISQPLARAITHEMGDITLLNRILDVARVRQRPEQDIDILNHTTKVYDRCRTNRNQYTHFGIVGVTQIRLSRNKGPNLSGPTINDDLTEIRRVATDCGILNSYLWNVIMYFIAQAQGQPEPLPDRFPLPALVWSPPPQAKPAPKRRPQS